MQSLKSLTTCGLMLAATLSLPGTAYAADILCQDPQVNHMLMDSSYVSACLDAGEGNLTGNPANDLFINGVGGAYSYIQESDWSQDGTGGDFTFDSTLWNSYGDIAIGFKFGTGNRPDEWFVFSLNDLVSTGLWEFVNVFDRGGGLSHVNLYGIASERSVPEGGGSVALLGLAFLALRRLRRSRHDGA